MAINKAIIPLLVVFLIFNSRECQAEESVSIVSSEPQQFRSFKIQSAAEANACLYTVAIKTSCSSTRFTRDQISLAFGDAYGNQVYAPRLDDPSSRAFERCSTDTYHLSGPCTYRICHLYLYRVGSDGWKPENVKIYTPDSRISTFNFNVFVPYGVWYGFNFCNSQNSDPMISAV
ncbi:hypothetical protein MKW94_013616 [Papaver nudicaule]|uniref:Uncharacterized protein n=1 Tax=Papaver nudicaule TaxID=74823 RepID=A0AA41RTA6_PAPNU|nr:hypothetical protein [Papaver nudicaule]MCL7027859.1 hypothetical protein [Papaver nudicaule]